MNKRAAGLMADFLLDGTWSAEDIATRWKEVPGGLGRSAKWPAKLIARIFEADEFAKATPSASDLAAFLFRDEQVGNIVRKSVTAINDWASSLNPLDRPPPRMTPAAAAVSWQLPSITTPGELADVLNISVEQLDWLADPRSFERTCEKERLRNYRYHWIEKSSGGQRLLEAPKATLKNAQRWIADNILCGIPVHEAAHAFRRGKSPVTAAGPHVNQHVVLRIDLCDFFPSISAPRIAGIFRTAGYPRRVTRLLTGFCTNAAWRGIVDGFSVDGTHFGIDDRDNRVQRFFRPHLPQGSPASPALANLASWKLDCRLSGLAKKFAARYTRYADDLIFSGDAQFGRELRAFRLLVCAICIDEGFEIRARKTRVMRCHQQQKVTGVVVNRKPSINRREYDLLKAILHNCRRFGPDSQNRDGHLDFRSSLAGRIAWISQIDSVKGTRLRRIFDVIRWPPG